MRGVILEFSELSGTGLISGEDNGRYAFSKDDVRSTTPIKAGQKVDFEPGEDGSARAIFILDEASTAPTPTPNPEPHRHLQYDLPSNHASLQYGLNPFQFFWKCLKLYADGRGRATVAEYWSFTLVYYLILIVGMFFVGFVSAVIAEGSGSVQSAEIAGAVLLILVGLIFLGLILPSITVTIRRFHDIGATGWIILIGIVPYLGGIVIFVMSLISSQKNANQYGPYYREVLDGTAGIEEVFG